MSNFLPDLLVSWPRHVDYPLFRKMIRENRGRFGAVVVVFTETSRKIDVRNFVRSSMMRDGIAFIENDPSDGVTDWRDLAVKKGLGYGDSPWVFFTEQDLTPLEGFWKQAENFVEAGYEIFGAFVDKRLHPCCIFAKRSLINKTDKYFGVVPDRLDHFGKFQEDVESTGAQIGEMPEPTYKHMNGLTQNMSILQNGEEPNYYPEEFKQYLQECLDLCKEGDFENTCAPRLDFFKLAREYLKK